MYKSTLASKRKNFQFFKFVSYLSVANELSQHSGCQNKMIANFSSNKRNIH